MSHWTFKYAKLASTNTNTSQTSSSQMLQPIRFHKQFPTWLETLPNISHTILRISVIACNVSLLI
jgi:hypothetical protein